MELIDKAAVVAEIERRKRKLLDHIICESDKEWVVRTAHQLNRIIMFIDTLEAKEVDLDWKNVRELCVLSAVVELEKGRSLTDQEHYTEVIKRFKAQKG